jgi:hypothetical protein
MRREGLGKMKEINDIWIRTRGLPPCSIVSRPITLPCEQLRNTNRVGIRKGMLWDRGLCSASFCRSTSLLDRFCYFHPSF